MYFVTHKAAHATLSFTSDQWVSSSDAPINSFWNRVRNCGHLEHGVNYKQLLKFNAKQTGCLEQQRKHKSRVLGQFSG